MTAAEISPSRWRKSSVSEQTGCVEVAATAGAVWVRDSKQVDITPLRLSPRAWSSLLSAVKSVAPDR